jgi:hypothetical protein
MIPRKSTGTMTGAAPSTSATSAGTEPGDRCPISQTQYSSHRHQQMCRHETLPSRTFSSPLSPPSNPSLPGIGLYDCETCHKSLTTSSRLWRGTVVVRVKKVPERDREKVTRQPSPRGRRLGSWICGESAFLHWIWWLCKGYGETKQGTRALPPPLNLTTNASGKNTTVRVSCLSLQDF